MPEKLKRQFPSLGGLYCCTMGATLEFPKATGDQWLQVVHDNDHWVLVAKTEAGHVSIYDSLAQSSVFPLLGNSPYFREKSKKKIRF